MMGDLRVEAVTRTMESPLGNRSQSVPKWKLPTGEPYAGKPPVRFGGRGGESLPYPYSVQGWQSSGYCKPFLAPKFHIPVTGFLHPCRNDEFLASCDCPDLPAGTIADYGLHCCVTSVNDNQAYPDKAAAI